MGSMISPSPRVTKNDIKPSKEEKFVRLQIKKVNSEERLQSKNKRSGEDKHRLPVNFSCRTTMK